MRITFIVANVRYNGGFIQVRSDLRWSEIEKNIWLKKYTCTKFKNISIKTGVFVNEHTK